MSHTPRRDFLIAALDVAIMVLVSGLAFAAAALFLAACLLSVQ